MQNAQWQYSESGAAPRPPTHRGRRIASGAVRSSATRPPVPNLRIPPPRLRIPESAFCILHCALLVPDPRLPPTHFPSRRLVKTMLADQIHPRAVNALDEPVPATRGAEPLAKAQVQRDGALCRRLHDG